MGTLGRATRNGKKRPAPRGARPERPHPAIAKLAVALREYHEAVEQQAATAEILRALSRSSADPRPVFEAIVENAHRITGAAISILYRYDGERLSVVAERHVSAAGARALRALYPAPPRRDHFVGRAVLEGRAMHSADAPNDPRFPGNKNVFAKVVPYRAALAVPLLKDGKVLGAIATERLEPKAFSKREIHLLRTFADQAVIAMENVRLFNETREALEHQKASADILRIVASSVENTDPVFEAITSAGMRLIPGVRVSLLMSIDGQLHYVSHSGVSEARRAEVAKWFPMPLSRKTIVGTSIIDRRVMHVPDVASVAGRFPLSAKTSRASGSRAMLAVPLVHKEKAVGSIVVTRETPGLFTDKQIALAKTFADQAVIAIRNAGMFREIQEGNAELKQSLEFQGATSEILASISSSIADTQPVFHAIVANVARLLDTEFAVVLLLRDGLLHLAAFKGKPGFEKIVESFPHPLKGQMSSVRAVLSGKVFQRAPIIGHRDSTPEIERMARRFGYNANISAPLIREGKVIGVITAARREPRPFDEKQVALIKAFADQAVIAIENVRLFNETKEALERQTATAEILKVIASSPSDVQPVFEAIARNALTLCGSSAANVYRYDGTQMHFVASHQVAPELVEVLYRGYPRPPDRSRATGRAILSKQVVRIEDALADPDYDQSVVAASGWRRMFAAPMLREGEPIGAIALNWPEPGPIPAHQEILLRTFADQAVMAIENVRLFNETKEALERQTATGEILRVMASSPGDVQPVFDTIARNASRLCNGNYAVVTRFDGELVHLAAQHNPRPGADAPTAQQYPRAPSRDLPSTRAVLERAVVHIPHADQDLELSQELVAKTGAGSFLVVPMMREGRPIGTIGVSRAESGPFPQQQIELVKLFADQAVIAIENVRLFNETKEALEQQTATSEILGVISSSPTDSRPVFDVILKSALQLCDAHLGLLHLREGDRYRTVAQRGGSEEFVKYVFERGAFKPDDGYLVRAAAERQPVHIQDLRAEPAYLSRKPNTVKFVEMGGARTFMAVPLLKENEVIGALVIYRPDVRPFTEKQIALVSLFANQAVIAIENARLFNETKEALERQTATAEILRVISSTPTDTQPVFDAIVQSAQRLMSGKSAILLLRRETDFFVAAYSIPGLETLPAEVRTAPLDRDKNFPSQVMLDRKIVHIPDWEADDVIEFERFVAKAYGIGSGLQVPLMRQGEGIGALAVTRQTKGPFSEKEIALLQSFADQAVIAIENARLFNETKEALERQKASAEILRVISGSLEDTSPVFEAIVASGARLYEAHQVGINVLGPDGRVTLRAYHGPNRKEFEAYMSDESRRAAGGGLRLKHRLAHFPDVEAGPEVPEQIRGGCRITGTKAIVYAPMVSGGKGIGAIWVGRDRVGPFSDKEIALLQTFADQAVIAIQNARLFGDTKEALGQQTAISEVLRVISDSPTDVKPVLDAVAVRAAKICEASDARIWLVEGGSIRHVAGFGDVPMPVELDESLPLDRGTVSGRAIVDRAAVHVEDMAKLTREDYPISREMQERSGFRTILSVPLMREQRALGAIMLRRLEVRSFSEKQIALLKTFADQAAIAIENVRLFNETQEALERQTATAEILKVIASSPSDVQPVFDALAETAARVCGANDVIIRRVEGDRASVAAHFGSIPITAQARSVAITRGTAHGRAILERRTIHVEDIVTEFERGEYRDTLALHGGSAYRTLLVAPLLREDTAIGAIVIRRVEKQPFSEKQVALLETFANQAVIAIENVRLFKELQARTDALTKSVNQLTALGEVGQAITSTLDLETVLKTIVQRAVQLTGLDAGAIYEYDAGREEFHLRAAENMSEEIIELLRKTPIKKGDGAVGGTAVVREPVQIPEIQDESYRSQFRELLIRTGRRALLAVPLMREEHIIGALAVQRNTPGPFAPEAVELLKTFATQSALAIQNARLFREIAEKGKQLEVASRHKSDFLASMSHELRTPLNALLGFNEMILGDIYGEVPADMKPPLAQMQSSGKHLLRLINNVLDLAKIEAGRMELALSDYSVHETVESVRSTLQPLAADKGLEFLAAVPSDIPLAHGDPGRITQCLMNLAGNSLKFTKAGKVEISVGLDDGWLRYRVADTGIGIPPEKIASLFTEFKQTDATIASEYGGTGLGLSISKKFVEMHGGRIWAESEPGKGSVFIFEIPLRAKAT